MPPSCAQSDDGSGSGCYSLREETGCAEGEFDVCFHAWATFSFTSEAMSARTGRPCCSRNAHHGRRDEIVEPDDRVGIVAEVLMGEIGHFLVFEGEGRGVQHDVPDVGEAERGVVVAQILRQPLGADQVDDAGRHAGHGRPRPLDRLDHAARFPPVGQRAQVGDVMLDLGVDPAKLGDDFRVVLEVPDLALDGLLDVILQREHVGDVAVDRFVPVACHDVLQGLR